MASEIYFFSQDGDSHWYMVPERLRARWQEFTSNDLEDEDEIQLFMDEFGEYAVGGGISGITFYVADEMQDIVEDAAKYQDLCK